MLGLYSVERRMIVPDDKFEKKKERDARVRGN